MADFPSNVTTETSSPQSSQPGGNGLAARITTQVDTFFIRSIPGLLMMAEILLGLLHWALIAGTIFTGLPAYGWVMFVAVTLWIFTTILFLIILFGVQLRMSVVPWPLTVMMYNAVATLLYFTAFVANAATVHQFLLFRFYGNIAAASFFGAVVTVVYGASTFFSYLDWRSDGGNAATSTVPT